MRGFGSYLLPDSKDLMSWKVGDNGFVMTLSSRVADVIRAGLRHWVTEWLASFGLDIQAVSAWAVHPGGPKI
ncbi:type III polyketide synthase, partial [Streptomyces sp. A3]